MSELTPAQRRYRAYLRTPHWRRMRQRILDRAENHCEECDYFCGEVEVLENWDISLRVEELRAQEVAPCHVCGSFCQFRSDQDNSGRVWLEVHHLTYERVGNERDDDLVALCCYCHEEVTARQDFRKLVRNLNPDLPKDASHAEVLVAHLNYLRGLRGLQ